MKYCGNCCYYDEKDGTCHNMNTPKKTHHPEEEACPRFILDEYRSVIDGD